MSVSAHPKSTSTLATQIANCVENVLAMPAQIDALANNVQELRRRQDTQDDVLSKLVLIVNRIEVAQAALLDRHVLLEDASKLQLVLGEQHFQKRVVDPLAGRLIPIIDFAFSSKGEQTDPNSLAHLVDGLREQLLELLGEFGCDCFESQEGDEFNARCMRPIATREAPSEELKGRVASSKRPGFRTADRVLRPESVVTYTNTILDRSEEE